MRRSHQAGAVGLAVTTLAGTGLAFAAIATALPSNCEEIPWGFFGSQRRAICDSERRPDGSWERHRVIGFPAYYRNAGMSCTGGYYRSDCTYYDAGVVPARIVEDTRYVVFDYNVVPGEPGHLG